MDSVSLFTVGKEEEEEKILREIGRQSFVGNSSCLIFPIIFITKEHLSKSFF